MSINFPTTLTVFRLFAVLGVALAHLFLFRPLGDWIALILFIFAAVTDYLDGLLARRWKQVTRMGAMLDPIADKAMVIIALLVVVGLSGMSPLLMFPAVLIIFREIFVSGLREFLGDTAGTLKSTYIAKWKTTVQLVAITVLLSRELFIHYLGMRAEGMDDAMFVAILNGTEEDLLGLRWLDAGWLWATRIGLVLLWLAAFLTVVSGLDYFRKALPYLKDAK